MIDVKDIDAIIGAEVMDTANDRIGRVSQVYIDSEDQHPSWVSVRTGFFGRSETLIPIDDARWESSTLFVQVNRAKVREAPHVDPDQELSVEEQTALYRYYGKGAPLEADGGEPSAPTDEVPEAEAPSEQAAPEQSASEQSAPEQSAPEAAVSEPAAEESHEDAVAEDAAAPLEDAAEPAAETGTEPTAETEHAEEPPVEAPTAESEQQPADETPVETQEDAVPDQSEPQAESEQVEPEQVEPAQAESEPTAGAADESGVLDDGLTAAEAEGGADQVAAAEPVSGRRRRSNYVQPEDEGQDDASAAEAAPDQPEAAAASDQPEVLTRYEERLRIATERVPSSRIRLVKRIVTEHHTVSVPVSHEELHIEREPIGEEEIAAWEGPMSELQEEEREIVLMAERPVVSTHTAPIERIRLVREIVSGTHDVEADLRHEQFDLDRGEQQG